MKLRNLLRTPLSFNLSDGTPVHLASREEMTGLSETLADDAQVVRRLKRGLIRIWSEAKSPEPIHEEPKEKESGNARGRSQRTTTRKREVENE